MKYFGGCDVGSTYTKTVILDETGQSLQQIRSRVRSTVLRVRKQGWIRRLRMPG